MTSKGCTSLNIPITLYVQPETEKIEREKIERERKIGRNRKISEGIALSCQTCQCHNIGHYWHNHRSAQTAHTIDILQVIFKDFGSDLDAISSQIISQINSKLSLVSSNYP